jgi:hypothetical protein
VEQQIRQALKEKTRLLQIVADTNKQIKSNEKKQLLCKYYVVHCPLSELHTLDIHILEADSTPAGSLPTNSTNHKIKQKSYITMTTYRRKYSQFPKHCEQNTLLKINNVHHNTDIMNHYQKL